MKKYLGPVFLTFIIPGLGHMRLGKPILGTVIALVYMICIVSVVAIPAGIILSTYALADTIRIVNKRKNG